MLPSAYWEQKLDIKDILWDKMSLVGLESYFFAKFQNHLGKLKDKTIKERKPLKMYYYK